jgi:GNAT superfamily N-acetyltransferase
LQGERKIPDVSGSVHIRRSSSADADALARLSTQLGYPTDAAAITRRLCGIAEREDGVVLVAASDAGAVLGFAQASPQHFLIAEPFVDLTALVVDEGVRGSGVGAALLRAVEQWSRERGFAVVRVRSNVIRERAHRFYLREGYAEHKRQAVFQKQLK